MVGKTTLVQVTGKTPNPDITLAFFVIALPGFYYPTPQNWQKAYKLPSSGESFPKKLHFHLAFQHFVDQRVSIKTAPRHKVFANVSNLSQSNLKDS